MPETIDCVALFRFVTKVSLKSTSNVKFGAHFSLCKNKYWVSLARRIGEQLGAGCARAPSLLLRVSRVRFRSLASVPRGFPFRSANPTLSGHQRESGWAAAGIRSGSRRLRAAGLRRVLGELLHLLNDPLEAPHELRLIPGGRIRSVIPRAVSWVRAV